MRRNAWQQLYKVATPRMDDHQFREEENGSAQMRRRKHFVEAQPGTAEAEQSTESGEIHEERGNARVQRTRKEGAQSRRAMPSSFAKCTKTNEQKKMRFMVPQELPHTNFDEQDVWNTSPPMR